MEIVTGVYNKTKLLVNDEFPVTHELGRRYYLDNSKTLIINFEEIDIHSYLPINYSKLYYHPNVDISYTTNVTLPNFLNELGITNFFEVNFYVNNSISWKQNGEWYTLISNAEFILQPILDYTHKHIRFYFNNDSSFFYKIVKGNQRLKKLNKIQLPLPEVVSYDLMDMYLFEGYSFMENYQLPNISNIKETVKNTLNGLDFYFVGTSIYEYARDVDIYIPPSQYDEAARRLDNVYGKIKDSEGHLGSLYKADTNIKIDLIPCRYDNLQTFVEDHHATPLFMYFIQVNYYASIKSDNVSELFKIWRFNKLLDTGYRLDILNSEYKYFNNTFLSKNRFELYNSIIMDVHTDELVDDFTIGEVKSIRYKDINTNTTYYIIKSLHPEQEVKFKIAGKIEEIKVLDGDSIESIISVTNEDVNDITIYNLNGYVLIKCKMYE